MVCQFTCRFPSLTSTYGCVGCDVTCGTIDLRTRAQTPHPNEPVARRHGAGAAAGWHRPSSK